MSSTEWYRRSTWTDADRVDFDTRLKRTRSAHSKAQYLRIQAVHLAEAGQHEGAIELLDRLLAEFPDNVDIALGHAQRAKSLEKLGLIDAAIEEYRAALQRERGFPNFRTNAWLDFGWLVVEKQLTGLFDEVARVLDEFRVEGGPRFPAMEYRYAAIQALLADARGETSLAREFAKTALAEATRDHSGLQHHPTLGLVGSERDTFESRLRTLAGS